MDNFFEKNGFLTVQNFLTKEEIEALRQIYDDFVEGRIDAQGQRSDLCGAESQEGKEKIVQIMRPSLLLPSLVDSPAHKKALALVRQLLGEDMDLDFDMLIDKAPQTNTETPWHQDEAYWLNMPDKRAATCWIALDDVVRESGCMWYVPGSHLENLRPHHQIGNKGALQCEATEKEAVSVEMHAGCCTFHHGRTAHYSRGNSTNRRRRAFILNFRPSAMIAYERERGYDHLGERSVKNTAAK